ncbi:hypothetical protein ACRRTK_017313 [Alexandromys fortis]
MRRGEMSRGLPASKGMSLFHPQFQLELCLWIPQDTTRSNRTKTALKTSAKDGSEDDISQHTYKAMYRSLWTQCMQTSWSNVINERKMTKGIKITKDISRQLRKF